MRREWLEGGQGQEPGWLPTATHALPLGRCGVLVPPYTRPWLCHLSMLVEHVIATG